MASDKWIFTKKLTVTNYLPAKGFVKNGVWVQVFKNMRRTFCIWVSFEYRWGSLVPGSFPELYFFGFAWQTYSRYPECFQPPFQRHDVEFIQTVSKEFAKIAPLMRFLQTFTFLPQFPMFSLTRCLPKIALILQFQYTPNPLKTPKHIASSQI